MASPAWWRRRRAWATTWLADHPGEQLACVVCDQPWSERRGDLHHRTYVRLEAERDDDLIPMCRTCHDHLHDIIDASPGWRRTDRAAATDVIIGHLRAHRAGKPTT